MIVKFLRDEVINDLRGPERVLAGAQVELSDSLGKMLTLAGVCQAVVPFPGPDETKIVAPSETKSDMPTERGK